MKPHKHAELIKAWADGAEIQHQHSLSGTWFDCEGDPKWESYVIYRIKPQQKHDLISVQSVQWNFFSNSVWWQGCKANLKLTFDGETGKLKSAEVI